MKGTFLFQRISNIDPQHYRSRINKMGRLELPKYDLSEVGVFPSREEAITGLGEVAISQRVCTLRIPPSTGQALTARVGRMDILFYYP